MRPENGIALMAVKANSKPVHNVIRNKVVIFLSHKKVNAVK